MAASQVTSVASDTAKNFVCGGVAGAISRSCVAPIDRVKILMQTQFIANSALPDKYQNTFQTLRVILKEEGVARLWRGNGTNMFRILPYSATQFASYDLFKGILIRKFHQPNPNKPKSAEKLHTWERLVCGGFAGSTATTLTHPLDVARLRLSVQPELKGALDAFRSLWAENGIRAMFKGYVPTVISIAPFIALNFTFFDLLKQAVYKDHPNRKNFLTDLALGAGAGILAQTICYPTDTVRRRMQMKGKAYSGMGNAFITIATKEGYRGFYRGMVPNAIKVVPNNAIRFMVYEQLKRFFNLNISGGSSSE